jgi:hypothetical protein
MWRLQGWEAGIAGRCLAKPRSRLRAGGSHRAGVHRTVIFSLEKVRSSWSAVFRKAIETDCVGCGPKLAIRFIERALLVMIVRLSGGGSVGLPVHQDELGQCDCGLNGLT